MVVDSCMDIGKVMGEHVEGKCKSKTGLGKYYMLEL
jgi:hypothetical protein